MISVMMSSLDKTNSDSTAITSKSKKHKQLMTTSLNESSNTTNDSRAMDAADTLVALANTPTNDLKPANFFKSLSCSSNVSSNSSSLSSPPSPTSSSLTATNNKKIEIILNTDQILDKAITDKLSDNNKIILNSCDQQLDSVESACKLIKKVLKAGNLASITIKTTATTNLDSETNTTNQINNTNTNHFNYKNQDDLTIDFLKQDLKRLSQDEYKSASNQIITSPTSSSTFTGLSACQAKKTKKFKHISDLNAEIIQQQEQQQPVKLEPLNNDKTMESKQNGSISSSEYSDSESRSSSIDTFTLNTPLTSNLIKSTYIVRPAPTLATGRRSKDAELPPEETKKRQERRERNKEAAARCRRKREDLANRLAQQADILKQQQDQLKRKYQEMLNEKKRLESLLETHEAQCSSNSSNTNTNHQQLIRIKKEEINEIIKQSSERKPQQQIVSQSKSESLKNNVTKVLNEKQPNLNLFRSQLSKDILSNLHLNQLMSQTSTSNLFDESTRALTPVSASDPSWTHQKQVINEALSPTSLGSSSSSSTSSSSSSTSISSSSSLSSLPVLMQRPNNLNLKSPLTNLPSPSKDPLSLSTYQNQMQNFMKSAFAYAFSSNVNNSQKQTSINNTSNSTTSNSSSIMTPTLQLNTPNLTPLEQQFIAAAVAATTSTPHHFNPILTYHLSQLQHPQQPHQQQQQESNQESANSLNY